MGSCCGGTAAEDEKQKNDEKDNNKITKGDPARDISDGPIKDRRCTDVIWLALWIFHLVGFAGITCIGLKDGNPAKLYKPRDYRGDYCGVSSNWNDGRDHAGYEKLIYMMNVTHTVDAIAKQLVCSSAAASFLDNPTTSGLTFAQREAYKCACCITPCSSCKGVLGLADLKTDAEIQSTIGGKMSELTDPASALSLYSSTGANGGSFSAMFAESASYFVSSCVVDCLDVTWTTDMRSYTYSPPHNAPWKTAWDTLASHASSPTEVKDTISSSFTFSALPKSRCNYVSPEYCVPMPGIDFTEVSSGYCTFKVAGDIAGELGDAMSYAGAADITSGASEGVGNLAGVILESLDVLAITCVLAFVISLVFLVALRFLVGFVIWGSLALVFILLCASGGAAYVRSGQCSGSSFTDSGTSYAAYAATIASDTANGVTVVVNLTAEEINTGDGTDYRGFQTTTRAGRTCQNWGAQTPWTHNVTSAHYAEWDLGVNYCRNPIGAVYIWCYTTDDTTRWELCSPMGVTPFDRECPEGYAIDDETMRKALEIFGYILWAMGGIWLILICCLMSRIRLAIAINKVAAEFVYTTPQIVLVPVCQCIVGCLWAMGWLFCASFLLSQVSDSYVPTDTYATYAEAYGTDDVAGMCTGTWPTGFVYKYGGDLTSETDPCSGNLGDTSAITPKCWACAPPRYAIDTRFAMSFFTFLWNNALLIAIGQTIIAGACAAWFFQKKADRKMLSSKPVRIAVRNVFRFHLGSLAFGSFIIAVVEFLRWVVWYFEKQAQQQKNKIMVIVLKVVQCCLWMFEKCLKFLTKNAFIQVAILGQPFCTSAKEAFYLIMRNVLRFGTLAALGAVLEIIGFMIIAVSTVFAGYYIFTALHEDLSPVGPMMAYMAVGYLSAEMFIGVFSMAVDSMIQCYIAAEELECDPENVPPALARLLPDYKQEKE